jgi:hypothetical protein
MHRARDATPAAVESARQEIGAAGVEAVRRGWPRDSGESARAWEWTGRAAANDARHAPFVHDGLHARLVPQVFRELEPTFANLVEQRIASAAGW